MMEMQVVLDFVCRACSDGVSVTVKCEGKGLALAARSVARVHVPCPHCGTIHCLTFQPNGILRSVQPCSEWQLHLEPSIN